MFKILRKKENKVEIVLDGEMSFKEPSLLDYEEYKKEEIRKQLKKAVLEELYKITPDSLYYPLSGHSVREDLADYLVHKVEI